MKILGVKAENRTGEDSDFITFDIADVNFIELWRPTKNADKIPMFHTKLGKFFQVGSLEGFSITLRKFGFTQLDTVNVVNLSNVEYVCESNFYTRAYFEDGTYTTISKSNLNKVNNIPKKAI